MAVISESKAQEMGFVCDLCGKVGPVNICSVGRGDPGHSCICSDCLKKKGWKHTHCKMPKCKGWVQRRMPKITQAKTARPN